MRIEQRHGLSFLALISLSLLAPMNLESEAMPPAIAPLNSSGSIQSASTDKSPSTESIASSPTASSISPTPMAQSQDTSATSAEELTTVVVKAKGLSQAAAFDQMHDSLGKLNVLSEDQIAQTPFKVVGQAVQELPGVGVQHDEGMPLFMQIRGTDENLNIITYNNTLIPSFVPSQSAVQVDAIPVGVVSNLELYKTILPNMDAQGIGGQVNLVPRSAFNYADGLLTAELEGGYNPEFPTGSQWTQPTYSGKLTWADTYQLGGDSKLGILLTGNYDNHNFGISDVEATYSSSLAVTNALSSKSIDQYSFRNEDYTRQTAGLAADIDLYADADNKYYLNFFGSGYDEWRDPKLVTDFNGIDVVTGDTINPDGSFTVTANNSNANDSQGPFQVESELTHVLTEDRTLAGQLGGENKFGGFDVDYKADYAWASQDEPDDYSYTFVNGTPLGGSITYNNSTNNGNAPSFNTSNLTGWNAANMVFSKVKDGPSNNYTNQFGIQADGKFDTPLDAGNTGAFKFGVAARTNYAQYSQQTWEAKASGSNTVTMAQFLGPADSYSYPGAPGGSYDMGPTLSPSIEGGANLGPFKGAGWSLADPVGDLGADWNSYQQIYAGYAMYTLTSGKMTVEGGARLEVTDIQFSWNNAYSSLYNAGGTQELANVSDVTTEWGSTYYANLFPGLGFKYDWTDDLVSRVNYSETIARPTYEEYVPAVGADSVVPGTDPTNTNNVQVGNANLQPMTSNNVDFSTEFYPQKGSIFAFDAFVKDINNYFTTNYALTDSGQGSTVSFSNIPYSQIYGYELQYQQQYTFLPWNLDGLGIRGAWDQNNSHGETTPGAAWTSLPSQSNLVFDAGIFYKKYGWTLDVDGAFTGKNIFLVGDQNSPTGPAPDIWYDDYFQVDAKVEYVFNKYLKFHINGDNLNNAPLRFYTDPGPNYPIQQEYYGPSFDGGVTLAFN